MLHTCELKHPFGVMVFSIDLISTQGFSGISGTWLQLGGINQPMFKWQDAGLMCKPLLPFVQRFPPRTFPTSPPGAILCYRFWSDHIIYSSQLFRFKNCLKSKWMALALNQSDFEHSWMRSAMVSMGWAGEAATILASGHLVILTGAETSCDIVGRQQCVPVQTREQTASHRCYPQTSPENTCFF